MGVGVGVGVGLGVKARDVDVGVGAVSAGWDRRKGRTRTCAVLGRCGGRCTLHSRASPNATRYSARKRRGGWLP